MRCACGIALEGQPGQAYNEEAFRHLLSVERRHAARTQRSCLLLLVSLRAASGTADLLRPEAASAIFGGLSVVVREVDFVGGFREERIAGAFLAQGTEFSAAAPLAIGERVTDAIGLRLTAADVDRLHVRVLRLRPRRPA